MFIGQIKTLRRQDIYVFFKLIPQVLNVISIHGYADFQRNFVSPKIPKNIKMIIKNSNFMFIGIEYNTQEQEIYFLKSTPQVLNLKKSIYGHIYLLSNKISKSKILQKIKKVIKNSNFMFIGENITLRWQNINPETCKCYLISMNQDVCITGGFL